MLFFLANWTGTIVVPVDKLCIVTSSMYTWCRFIEVNEHAGTYRRCSQWLLKPSLTHFGAIATCVVRSSSCWSSRSGITGMSGYKTWHVHWVQSGLELLIIFPYTVEHFSKTHPSARKTWTVKTSSLQWQQLLQFCWKNVKCLWALQYYACYDFARQNGSMAVTAI